MPARVEMELYQEQVQKLATETKAINEGRIDLLEDLYTVDGRIEEPVMPHDTLFAYGNPIEITEFFQKAFHYFVEDIRFEPLPEDNCIRSEWIVRGKHDSGEFLGIEVTGREFVIEGTSRTTFNGDLKIIHTENHWFQHHLWEQLGKAPEPSKLYWGVELDDIHQERSIFVAERLERLERLMSNITGMLMPELADPLTTQPRFVVGLDYSQNLTRRELEVLGLVANGLTNPEIAGALTISEATVRSYMKTLYAKTGVLSANRVLLARYADALRLAH